MNVELDRHECKCYELCGELEQMISSSSSSSGGGCSSTVQMCAAALHRVDSEDLNALHQYFHLFFYISL